MVTSALLPLAVSRAKVVWLKPLYWKLWAVVPPMPDAGAMVVFVFRLPSLFGRLARPRRWACWLQARSDGDRDPDVDGSQSRSDATCGRQDRVPLGSASVGHLRCYRFSPYLHLNITRRSALHLTDWMPNAALANLPSRLQDPKCWRTPNHFHRCMLPHHWPNHKQIQHSHRISLSLPT